MDSVMLVGSKDEAKEAVHCSLLAHLVQQQQKRSESYTFNVISL